MRALRPAPGATPGATGPTAPPGAEPPVFHTVRGGLSRLVDALAVALGARGVEVRLQSPVQRLELRDHERRDLESAGGPEARGAAKRWALHGAGTTVEADAVVVAIPAAPAAALLAPVEATVAAMLGAIDYADVTLVTLQLPADGVGRPLEGTGFLVPASAGRLITACTWLTSKWPELQRPGDVLLRASLGRSGDDRPGAMSDEEIVRGVLEDLEPMLGLRAQPIDVVVTRWSGAFPQYGVGHARARVVDRACRVPVARHRTGGRGLPRCGHSGVHRQRSTGRGSCARAQRRRRARDTMTDARAAAVAPRHGRPRRSGRRGRVVVPALGGGAGPRVVASPLGVLGSRLPRRRSALVALGRPGDRGPGPRRLGRRARTVRPGPVVGDDLQHLWRPRAHGGGVPGSRTRLRAGPRRGPGPDRRAHRCHGARRGPAIDMALRGPAHGRRRPGPGVGSPGWRGPARGPVAPRRHGVARGRGVGDPGGGGGSRGPGPQEPDRARRIPGARAPRWGQAHWRSSPPSPRGGRWRPTEDRRPPPCASHRCRVAGCAACASPRSTPPL